MAAGTWSGERAAELLGGDVARRRWALATARRRWGRRQRWQSAAAPTRRSGAATHPRDACATRYSSIERPPPVTLAQLERHALSTRGGGRVAVDRTVHVSGLRGETESAAKLAALFEEAFGPVAAVTVRPRGQPPRGKPIGVALISFGSAVAARLALRPVATSSVHAGRLCTDWGLTVRPLEAHATGGLVVRWHKGSDALSETIAPELMREHAERCMLHEVDQLVNYSLAEAARPGPRSAASVVPGQSTPREPVGRFAGSQSETNTLGPPSYVASLLSPRSDAAQVARREEIWRRIHAAASVPGRPPAVNRS